MKNPSNIRGGRIRIPSPDDPSVHKTERSGVAVVAGWIREIIAEKALPLGAADVDTSGADRKSPDLVIYEHPGGGQALVVGEFKPPTYDAFDETALKKPAHEKANRRRAPYFVTSNFRDLVWYSTERVNAMAPDEQQWMAPPYPLSAIESLDVLEDGRVAGPFKQALAAFLEDLVAVHSGKRPAPRLPLDTFLVVRLHALVEALSRRYHHVLAARCHKDPDFERRIEAWFRDQGWEYHQGFEPDHAKVARQAAFLLVNKVLFYHVLQSQRPKDLDPLEIPEGLTRGGLLRRVIQAFFDEVVRRIDYETIYSTDFIDDVAFPDDPEAVRLVVEMNRLLRRHDLRALGYDILGPVFERLIPEVERHVLGQYFTNPRVVDLILGFCVRHERDAVLDPSCGAGTFLVRAYQRKRAVLNPRMGHFEVLATLWGCDIAKFPAHLATINLALNDLSVQENYPLIFQSDFFDIVPGGFSGRKFRVQRVSGETTTVAFPESVDAVVGNPPYTRQEEVSEITPGEGLVERALRDAGVERGAISGRAGIHAWFIVHATKFLRDQGRFGFVVTDTWLDEGYGIGLKRFIMANYRIVMVVASKVERWFTDAKVNTCILLMARETDEAARQASTVRFVLLKRPLADLIPAGGGPTEERARWAAIASLLDLFSVHDRPYENAEARITPVAQASLAPEDKWGLYLRAPRMSDEVLRRNAGGLRPLRDLAEVRRGVTSGADPWFYVREVTSDGAEVETRRRARARGFRGDLSTLALVESGDGTRWLIEREFLQPIARHPNRFRKIRVRLEEAPDRVVVLPPVEKKDLQGRMVLHYIAHGERHRYAMGKGRRLVPAKTQTCAARACWYALPDTPRSRLLWVKAFDIRFRHLLAEAPLLANQRFYPVVPAADVPPEFLAAVLNSAWFALWIEVQRPALGEGNLDATVGEAQGFRVPDPRLLPEGVVREVERALSSLADREIGTVFEEYGAQTPEDVRWEALRPDRRALEDAVLGGVLGLSVAEREDLVRALVDLTRSRIERARSVRSPEEEDTATLQGVSAQIAHNVGIE